ncbi:MAG: CYTH domain protein [Alphaproteobacteria bacterium ADurb.Bin438]|nr:MAG: CYTH domain protein [Alphaproteobacteria bacterium ADurb.Bin438]
MQDTEVEITYIVNEEFFNNFKQKLLKEAKFIKTQEQFDEYFTPAHTNYIDKEYPNEWLSIRSRGGKTIVNYKNWHKVGGVSCDELEALCENKDDIRKIFMAVGMKSLCTVTKHRDIFMMGNFEIALDYLKELGYFIEIETKGDFETIKEAEEALYEFARKLNLDGFKQDTKGYPMLIIENLKKG